MTDYKCWEEEEQQDAAVVSGKDPAEAAARFAKLHIPSSEWPEGWPGNAEFPLMVEVENHGTYKVWPRTEVVPKSALKEEYQNKYDSIEALWFYAVRNEPITVKERIPTND